jgi:poly(3-hydroxybutyrate) depolymerase
MATQEAPLTTGDVPPQFLSSAFLVGQIPLKALTSDPRISYAVYVPPAHYSDPGASGNGKKLPLLVNIHGTRRDISPIYTDLVPFANSTPCAILAPLFPAGLDGPNDLHSYKVLRSETLRSDLALLSILDEISVRWPGIETSKVFLMGFSGGGQFAHRFLYLYPERLAAVSAGAPGSVTILDDQQKWPKGVADVESLFDVSVKKDLIKEVPIQLIVGGDDVGVHGSTEFWNWLKSWKAKSNGRKSEGQGNNELAVMKQGRRETIESLRKKLKQDGIEVQLEVVDGVKHHGKGVRKHVLEYILTKMRESREI